MVTRIVKTWGLLTCLLFSTSNLAYGAAEVSWAGFRSSVYGVTNPGEGQGTALAFPGPEAWTKAGQAISANFSEETVPTMTWIVGTVNTDDLENGGLQLEMKRPGPEYQDIRFIDDPNNEWANGHADHEAWLSYFDEQGVQVVLQVEPGHSDILPIIQLVMETWGKHESVIGFGVDIEWYKNSNGDGGGDARVSAATMLEWLKAIQQYKPEGKLMVKHWAAENLADGNLEEFPQETRQYLIFCNDSQGVGSLEVFIDSMKSFADAYEDGDHSADIWFQIGYSNDWWTIPSWAPENKPWFHSLKEGWEPGKDGIPAEDRKMLPEILGNALAEGVSPNQKVGIIWVDFTMRHLYPDIFTAPAQ